ncbi:MAG TPA: S49 family peptidase, partial [Gemmatimonadaceae bacterium]|nr:S49 family peptidase [Gemmatimonadaceae bacterium]
MKRGIRFVLIFIGLAVMASMAGVVLMYLAVSRGPTVPSTAMLVLRPGGEIQEVVPDDVFGLLAGNTQTVRGFIDGLEKAKRDPRIRAVLLMPSALSSPYWGKLQELRDAIVDFRKSGKKVVAFLEYGGDREYYLASAADKVYLLPTSSLDLVGVATYEMFLRGTLDKIDAYPDFLHVGQYKTAVNQMTEKGFT